MGRSILEDLVRAAEKDGALHTVLDPMNILNPGKMLKDQDCRKIQSTER